jgi:NAD(P)-dependent dehydrogenase (short-subunit alcohol dehydrogenase family)
MRLQGTVAVITGAGSGIGRAMTILFATEGAKIVAGEWNAQALDDLVATVRAAGGEITGIQGNVAVQAEAEGWVDTAVNTYGRLNVLCNNAGVMDLIMVQQGGGSIINIASVAGLGGGAAGAAYTVSKHGLVGLTKSTAWMYAQKGIRCNAICPGAVETNILASVDQMKMDPTGSERTSLYVSIMPEFLEAVDIAQLALFLASDEARYINGAVIPADAGWRAA